MRGHVDAMEAALGRSADRLIVSGGGSRSDLMMRIVADVFGRPAERARMPDAAAMVGHGTTFAPHPETRARYETVLKSYAVVPEYTDPLFRRSTDLYR